MLKFARSTKGLRDLPVQARTWVGCYAWIAYFLFCRAASKSCAYWLLHSCQSSRAWFTLTTGALDRDLADGSSLGISFYGGTRAGLFGNEAGQFEAWVYPLKILRDFHLRFHLDGRVIPAEALARTITVRPESSTILYTGDTFAVRETFFVPVREPGAVIIIEVETAEPLDVQAVFERDFQLEWPAALGGTYAYWDPKVNAFHFGEEQKKFSAFVGSPTAVDVQRGI